MNIAEAFAKNPEKVIKDESISEVIRREAEKYLTDPVGYVREKFPEMIPLLKSFVRAIDEKNDELAIEVANKIKSNGWRVLPWTAITLDRERVLYPPNEVPDDIVFYVPSDAALWVAKKIAQIEGNKVYVAGEEVPVDNVWAIAYALSDENDEIVRALIENMREQMIREGLTVENLGIIKKPLLPGIVTARAVAPDGARLGLYAITFTVTRTKAVLQHRGISIEDAYVSKDPISIPVGEIYRTMIEKLGTIVQSIARVKLPGEKKEALPKDRREQIVLLGALTLFSPNYEKYLKKAFGITGLKHYDTLKEAIRTLAPMVPPEKRVITEYMSEWEAFVNLITGANLLTFENDEVVIKGQNKKVTITEGIPPIEKERLVADMFSAIPELIPYLRRRSVYSKLAASAIIGHFEEIPGSIEDKVGYVLDTMRALGRHEADELKRAIDRKGSRVLKDRIAREELKRYGITL